MGWFRVLVELGAVVLVVFPTWALPRARRLAPTAAPPWWPWSEKTWFRASSAGPTCAIVLWGTPFIWLTEVLRDPPGWIETVSLVGSFWTALLLPVAVVVFATQRLRRFVPPKFRPVS